MPLSTAWMLPWSYKEAKPETGTHSMLSAVASVMLLHTLNGTWQWYLSNAFHPIFITPHKDTHSCTAFEDNAKLSCRVAVSFYIPTSNILFSPHLHQHLVLFTKFLNLAILTYVEQDLAKVLIHICLMAGNEFLFKCLFAICISSLMKCLPRPFAPFLFFKIFFILKKDYDKKGRNTGQNRTI